MSRAINGRSLPTNFSSIAGAGPVTGPVMAMMFGWLPAFLWIIVGGIFFGAVQDFASLYTSVKSDGNQSASLLKYILERPEESYFSYSAGYLHYWSLRLSQIWLRELFHGFRADGSKLQPNAAAASISILLCFLWRLHLDYSYAKRKSTAGNKLF